MLLAVIPQINRKTVVQWRYTTVILFILLK